MARTVEARAHPAFARFDQVLPLSGFSGATIALAKPSGGVQFVRKAATNSAANDALRHQANRQAWLRSQLNGVAQVPEVLNDGEIDGLYYFDMPFVPSRDANAYLTSAPFDELAGFAERVEQLMRRLSETRVPDSSRPPASESIHRKVEEIARRTHHRFDDLLEPLRRTLASLDELVPGSLATVTHGDLTFENILVGARRELWLIDPIDSPVDHYWIDWSKLFQDCEGRWHLHRGKRLPLNVTRWLRHRWMAAATSLAPGYASRHYLLLALTFARILPYARSKTDLNFVIERVRAFGQAAEETTRGS